MARNCIVWTILVVVFGFAACTGNNGAQGPKGDIGDSGEPGTKGDNGSSCTVTDDGSGTKTISCSDGTRATLSDGQKGDKGADGAKGNDGTKGSAGTSCTVINNGDGTKTVSCTDGTSVTVADGQSGTNSQNGTNGTNGRNGTSCSVTDLGDGTKRISCGDGSAVTVSDGANVQIRNFHGTDYLMSHGEYANGAKTRVVATIIAAAADADGKVTADFKVEDELHKPVSTVTSVSADVVQLIPGAPRTAQPFSKWVSYFINTATAGGAECGTTGAQAWNCPPWSTNPTAQANQGGSESSGTGANNGTLTNNGDGTYRYAFKKTLGAVTDPTTGATVSYDRTRTHRVSIMMGGHSGPTADANFDFVPDGSQVTVTRDIIRTEACKTCHGEEFHGHGGNRLSVENCATCHLPGTKDPQTGTSLDLKAMIHKIHAGGELPTAAGADGVLWDDPTTTKDETADNNNVIFGYQNSKNDFWKIEFPAVIANCTKCHDGTGANADNWKLAPSIAACSACHDDVDFVTGTNHKGGAETDDVCSVCHQANTSSVAPSIVASHDWMSKDIRNVPEFVAQLSLVNKPANNSYFVAGESPQIKIVLLDNEATGNPVIDPSSMPSEPSGGAEGCVPNAENQCPTGRDGYYDKAILYVHGPRGFRMPVLVTGARSQILSTATSFNLSALTAANLLTIKVDGGGDVIRKASGADTVYSGNISLPIAASTTCVYADSAAATASEVAACLNANAAFAARAIAWNEGGTLGIRSRNLGTAHSLQVSAGTVTTALFGTGATVTQAKLGSGGGDLRSDKGDPKVTRDSGAIYYQLDSVDDLEPGTYVATVEIADRGRASADSYKTPTVAKFSFQVKTGTEEPQIAGACNACHENKEGKGQVFDPARHQKIFDATANDQCGACHDYQPGSVTGSGWSGTKPISKRVHALHYGANLHYPVITVDHADEPANRFWDIEFPQDIRNCETCHPKETSGGTWATKAARIPCMGCHDDDAAVSHMKSMVYDPTPADLWNGDEQESCKTCH